MFHNMTVSAVVVAAGSGTRMGADVNKVFLPLGPEKVPALLYSLAALDRDSYVDEIIVVARPRDQAEFDGLAAHPWFPKKPVEAVCGGEKRFESVYGGVTRAAGDIVLIHDGARPLLKQRYIDECVQAMAVWPGAVVGIPSADRICVLGEDGCLIPHVTDRRYYRVQTPQCFRRAVFLECFDAVKDKTAVRDDSGLLELCGYKVKLILGDETNLKLTVPADVAMAERFLEGKKA
ncbi:MAG: 2-C-methyl-D-erythritol 4-phosphate cytidylyltransferase [Firmicutes bacterium]|nr:2-C-methyl-D-erythritol 4-phosphate cytidylyltransferase [Bacillota bacterium]